MIYILALVIGVIAGLRAMTAPAAMSWAAWLGLLPLSGTVLGFLGSVIAAVLLTVLAIGELIADQLPKTPSRKAPPQFIGRIICGGLSGAALGMLAESMIGGLVAGVIGAVIGTLAGAEVRGRLARGFGHDMPAAFIEDAVAIGGAVAVVAMIT